MGRLPDLRQGHQVPGPPEGVIRVPKSVPSMSEGAARFGLRDRGRPHTHHHIIGGTRHAHVANGWPALGSTSTRLHTWIIPARTGSIRLRVREGSAGFLLAHFALWLAGRPSEPLRGKVADDWGYASRPIRGQATGLSNHAAGCAIDLNATRHALGKRGTSGRTKAARIVARLALWQGCLRWEWPITRRADEMHFEVVQSLASCETVARRLIVHLCAAAPAARQPIPESGDPVARTRRVDQSLLTPLSPSERSCRASPIMVAAAIVMVLLPVITNACAGLTCTGR